MFGCGQNQASPCPIDIRASVRDGSYICNNRVTVIDIIITQHTIILSVYSFGLSVRSYIRPVVRQIAHL